MLSVPLLFCFSICGTLHSVDQFLNIKLTDINVTDPDKYPHMVGIDKTHLELVPRQISTHCRY